MPCRFSYSYPCREEPRKFSDAVNDLTRAAQEYMLRELAGLYAPGIFSTRLTNHLTIMYLSAFEHCSINSVKVSLMSADATRALYRFFTELADCAWIFDRLSPYIATVDHMTFQSSSASCAWSKYI